MAPFRQSHKALQSRGGILLEFLITLTSVGNIVWQALDNEEGIPES